MAWVRIHDGAMTHPKIVEINDKAFRLWVWSLAYSQQHLTDGRIPVAALPVRLKRAATDLVTFRLWDATEKDGTPLVGVWQVHDYLEWNDSRSRVKEKQSLAKRRLDDWRDKQAEARLQNASTPAPTQRVANALETLHTPNLTKPNQTKEERKNVSPPLDARSKWPIFKGQKLVVFDWMLEQLGNLLAPHTDAFRLDEWFDTLDKRCVRDGIVPPARDNGEWLKAETLAEAQRRGLPLKVASVEDVNRPTGPSKRPYEVAK